MKKLLLALPIILLIAVASVYLYRQGKLDDKTPSQKPIEENYEITGVLREMLVDEELRNSLMLKSARYELVQLNAKDNEKLPYKVFGIYIEAYPGNLNNMLGNCVTIRGRVNRDWLQKTEYLRSQKKAFIYNAINFEADSVDKKDFADCEGYTMVEKPTIPENTEPKVLTGIIERRRRDIPDIGPYDYQLVLDEPYKSQDTEGAEIYIRVIAVKPKDNAIWVKIENNIREKQVVEAFELNGLNQTKYLLINRIME